MRGPVTDKQRRNPFSQGMAVVKVIIFIIFLGVVLQQIHKQAFKPLPHLTTTAHLQQHLQQLAADATNSTYAEGVLALARDLEKQLAQSKELGENLAKAKADLAVTKTVVAKQEHMLEAQAAEAAQKQEQLSQQLQQAQAALAASPPSNTSPPATPVSLGPTLEQARLQALATAGDACGLLHHAEFGGDLVVWGSDHRAIDAAECCAACLSHRRTIARGGTEKGRNTTACNIWVFCGDRDKCGKAYGECWLKHQDLGSVRPPALPVGAVSNDNRWTSGVIHDSEETIAFAADDAALQQTAFVMHTSLGDAIEVQLLPELAPKSVREVQRLVAMLAATRPLPNKALGQPASYAIGHCSNCRIYRAEKGWLAQGVLEAPGAYVGVPRFDPSNPPQRTVMERGLMCWAGGGGGPHWFVNMIDNNHFKDEHLCFAKVAEHHMAVFERILTLPLKQKKKPSDMNILQEAVTFNVSFKQEQGAKQQQKAQTGQ